MAKLWIIAAVHTLHRSQWAGDGAVGADDGPGEVRLLNLVAEQHHLPGDTVHFRMGTHAGDGPAEVVQANGGEVRSDFVRRGALGQRQVPACMPDDVDERVEPGTATRGSGRARASLRSMKAGVSRPPNSARPAFS